MTIEHKKMKPCKKWDCGYYDEEEENNCSNPKNGLLNGVDDCVREYED